MRMRQRVAIGLVAAAVLVAVLPTAALGSGDVFQPSDKSPAANPCGKKVVDDTAYKEFKDLLKDLLGDKAGVVDDIDTQVKGKVDDTDEKPVTVEIEVIDEKEFVKAYAEDVEGLFKDKKKADLEKDARDIFKKFAAYTYITKDFNDSGTQIIKIAVFCKKGLRTGTIDGSIRELIIHELVHAKLYTMLVLGVAEDDWPFPDHDDDADNDDEAHDDGGDKEFWDEIKRLYDKLKENLEISYAPGSRFELPVEAVVAIPRDLEVPLEVPVVGRMEMKMGDAPTPAGGVEIEIVAMELVGVAPILGPVQLQAGGLGRVGPGLTGDFPAESFFDVSYELRIGELPASAGTSHLRAAPNHWPPFSVTFLPEIIVHPGPGGGGDDDPGPIVVDSVDVLPGDEAGLLSLTVVAEDRDGDGVPDFIDPDDDQDGVPDVEDPWPHDPRKPKLKKRTASCETVPDGPIARCPWFSR